MLDLIIPFILFKLIARRLISILSSNIKRLIGLLLIKIISYILSLKGYIIIRDYLIIKEFNTIFIKAFDRLSFNYYLYLF